MKNMTIEELIRGASDPHNFTLGGNSCIAELIRRDKEKDARIADLEQKLKEKDAETLIRNIRQHLNTYEHCCDDCHKIDVMILEYEKLKEK